MVAAGAAIGIVTAATVGGAAALERELPQDIVQCFDQRRAMAQQAVAAARLRRVDRARDGENVAAEIGGELGGDQ